MIALIAVLATLLGPSDKVLLAIGAQAPVATPIGPGSAYRPPAGRPVESCAAPSPFAVHLELIANRRAIVIPAGIGACSDPVRTRTPTGVVGLARRDLVVGDLFRIWGRPLGDNRLLSFSSRSPVRAYVNGRPGHGPVASVALTPGAEIVLEVGGYVPPHASYLFPGSSS